MGIGFTGGIGRSSPQLQGLARVQGQLLSGQGRLSAEALGPSARSNAEGRQTGLQIQRIIEDLDASSRNIEDGVRLLVTTDSGLSRASDLVNRLRDLAVEADDDSLSSEDRGALITEFEDVRDQLDGLSATTEFNGINLLGSGFETAPLQSGVYSTETIEVEGLDTSSSGLGLAALDLDSSTSAADALSSLDDALKRIEDKRSTVASAGSELQTGLDSIFVARQTLSIAETRPLTELEKATEAADYAAIALLQNAGVASQLHGLIGGSLQALLFG